MTYQNPYLLHYFLLKEPPYESNYQIVKSTAIDFGDRILDLAIIGSSHFLHLRGSFCELLTCAPPSTESYIFHCKSLDEPFSVQHQFDDFSQTGLSYSFQQIFHKYSDEEFEAFESDLAKEEHLLYHAFEKESAITSIQLLEKQSHYLKLQTWHTYPESKVCVQTLTTLKI